MYKLLKWFQLEKSSDTCICYITSLRHDVIRKKVIRGVIDSNADTNL